MLVFSDHELKSKKDNPYYPVDFEDEGKKNTGHKEKRVPVSVGSICSEILQNEKLYLEWVPILNVYLVLPVSSAECERGVSVMGELKTPERNRMRQALLEQSMFLKINGPGLIVFCEDEEDSSRLSFMDQALRGFFIYMLGQQIPCL